jgi:hypothetical protein
VDLISDVEQNDEESRIEDPTTDIGFPLCKLLVLCSVIENETIDRAGHVTRLRRRCGD